MSNLPQPRGVRPVRSPIDEIRHVVNQPNGEVIEFWSAREAMPHLGYARWENMENVIGKAKSACRNAGHDPSDHFRDVTKMVNIGSRSQRRTTDVQLSRVGMYLVAMNGDPDKNEIAAAQRYFVIQTYRAEQQLPPLGAPPALLVPGTAVVALRPWMERIRATWGRTAR